MPKTKRRTRRTRKDDVIKKERILHTLSEVSIFVTSVSFALWMMMTSVAVIDMGWQSMAENAIMVYYGSIVLFFIGIIMKGCVNGIYKRTFEKNLDCEY